MYLLWVWGRGRGAPAARILTRRRDPSVQPHLRNVLCVAPQAVKSKGRRHMRFLERYYAWAMSESSRLDFHLCSCSPQVWSPLPVSSRRWLGPDKGDFPG